MRGSVECTATMSGHTQAIETDTIEKRKDEETGVKTVNQFEV